MFLIIDTQVSIIVCMTIQLLSLQFSAVTYVVDAGNNYNSILVKVKFSENAQVLFKLFCEKFGEGCQIGENGMSKMKAALTFNVTRSSYFSCLR